MEHRLHILILAAGAARRMGGRDKLLERVEGLPLLRRVAEHALATGAPVHVVLPPPGQHHESARRDALDGLALNRIPSPRAAEGMAHSLRAGICGLPPDAEGALILLADMPEIESADMRRLLAAFARRGRARALRGADGEGRPGHPVLLSSALFQKIMRLEGDRGAAAILRDEAVPPLLVPLGDDRARVDLDTPEAWAAWRAQSGRRGQTS